MDVTAFKGNNPTAMAGQLQSLISADMSSSQRQKARESQAYYDYKPDILKNRIFYVDGAGILKEDKYASNIKIPHSFHTELVDQKVQFLLSNPVQATVEDPGFQEKLDEYYTDEMQVFLQETLEGSSIKGYEYAFARTNSNDVLCFQVADSLKTLPVYDNNNELVAIIRSYKKRLFKENKYVNVFVAEVWNDKEVYFFVKDEDNGDYQFDTTRDINPRPHVAAIDSQGKKLGRSYGVIPFYRLANNRKEKTDLEPIKDLIDDYDLMNAFMSNNLQDMTEAIYVVKGYQGDDLSTLRQNVKAKKTVGVSEQGGIDIKTVDIPTEARKTKMDLDKENIYKFGMGFDSTAIGDGNITNVVIKSRYSLLNMKANKAEVRLRALLAWCNKLIVDDINRRYNTTYKATDIEVTIKRSAMVNDSDVANIDKLEAETKQTVIATILAAAPRLDDETVLKLICKQYDLDWEEVQKLIEEQDYTTGLAAGTDPADKEGVNNEDVNPAGQVE